MTRRTTRTTRRTRKTKRTRSKAPTASVQGGVRFWTVWQATVATTISSLAVPPGSLWRYSGQGERERCTFDQGTAGVSGERGALAERAPMQLLHACTR